MKKKVRGYNDDAFSLGLQGAKTRVFFFFGEVYAPVSRSHLLRITGEN